MKVDQRLAALLAPTLKDGPGVIFDHTGQLAVIPIDLLTRQEMLDACALQCILGRGVLVVA